MKFKAKLFFEKIFWKQNQKQAIQCTVDGLSLRPLKSLRIFGALNKIISQQKRQI